MVHLSSPARGFRNNVDFGILAGLIAAILFFIAAGLLSYFNSGVLQQNSLQIVHTHEVILNLDDLVSIMKDAETGQRGFLITGDEKYLEPYTSALSRIDGRIERVRQLLRDEPEQLAQVPEIEMHIKAKLAELRETIELRRTQGFDVARGVVVTDRGKNEMDAMRSQLKGIEAQENTLRASRIAEMDRAYKITVSSGIAICLFGMLLSGIVAYLMRRSSFTRQQQEWLQVGQVGLSEAILGELRVEQVGQNVLEHLAEYLGAAVGAFFTRERDVFRRAATYGIPDNADLPEAFALGESLLGQAAKDERMFVVHEVPDGYLKIGSALGRGNPRHLLIAPVMTDNMVNGVFEFGFIERPSELAVLLLEKVSELVAVAIRSANYRAHLQNLLEETQRQAEELQTQSEELRVNNEELEEQSRALKLTQSNLEQQQAELEQTNSQLGEQAQLLEIQRDELTKSKEEMQLKARELAQASQYKSDFLANMSHELRTPLNSSLILAKLLADNPHNNLTAEQVKFAQTIESSGNDLLVLINDILDLSKIESGHMEINAAPVTIERLSKDLKRLFEVSASQKGLTLKITIDKNAPSSVETDAQRLEQVLKNLISNSIKFTESGSVELAISRSGDKKVSFAVIDTGIGIEPENQQAIFDAFRQADGTINRKYGGTGLGLSISKELTRLLAGEITLTSQAGKGSTFVVTIPEIYASNLVSPKQTSQAPLAQHFDSVPPRDPEIRKAGISQAAAGRVAHSVNDDRDALDPTQKTLLVVEDDESFAKILYDIAHEREFQCLLANNAEDAVSLAKQFMPSAVLLDVGLPDNSGLSVLDRLKRDARTRHIPVHVISAGDYTQTALSLGAIGYMSKPVKRDQLLAAVTQLEKHFRKGVRRILIVEDNLIQRESMIKLLTSPDVELVAVGSAAECLEKLKSITFDCMVLDLSLPDASGYSLLETISKEETYSFPPVIVYTGRDLSIDEEQKLRRYSSAIIIKGAKSPERLLDEVTLFLHKVVAELPPEQQRILETVRNRDALLEGRRMLVVEDDVRNVYALTSIFEPLGVTVEIARNGKEALNMLEKSKGNPHLAMDLILMDVMMPEMDGLTATREIRKNAEWKKTPIIMLTAKAMKDDQERCLACGANDYMAKPLDVEKLLSLVRVWMPR